MEYTDEDLDEIPKDYNELEEQEEISDEEVQPVKKKEVNGKNNFFVEDFSEDDSLEDIHYKSTSKKNTKKSNTKTHKTPKKIEYEYETEDINGGSYNKKKMSLKNKY